MPGTASSGLSGSHQRPRHSRSPKISTVLSNDQSMYSSHRLRECLSITHSPSHAVTSGGGIGSDASFFLATVALLAPVAVTSLRAEVLDRKSVVQGNGREL